MIPYVVDEILSKHIDHINPDFVDNDEVIKEINQSIFHSDKLDIKKYQIYDGDSLRSLLIKEIKKFLIEKMNSLTPETFNNSARNAIISNMDDA